MTIPIIVWTKLNHHDIGRNAEYYRQVDTPEWVAARVEVYLKYTVASLDRQTDRDFAVWLNCRPGTEELLAPHVDRLKAAGVLVTFYQGAPHTRHGPLHSGRPSCFPASALDCDATEAWLVRIDSDDMLSPNAINMTNTCCHPRGLLFSEGHAYDVLTGRLWPWRHHSPPFYAERCEVAGRNLIAPGRFGSHGTFRDKIRPEIITGGSFLVLRHPPGPAFHSWQGGLPLGRELQGGDKAKLLEYYGVPK